MSEAEEEDEKKVRRNGADREWERRTRNIAMHAHAHVNLKVMGQVYMCMHALWGDQNSLSLVIMLFLLEKQFEL